MLGTKDTCMEGSWDGLTLEAAEREGTLDGIPFGASELILGLPLGKMLRLGASLLGLVG